VISKKLKTKQVSFGMNSFETDSFKVFFIGEQSIGVESLDDFEKCFNYSKRCQHHKTFFPPSLTAGLK
jgi:hypothetical protein